MKTKRFTTEIIQTLEKYLPEFEVIGPDQGGTDPDPDRSYFALATPTLDGRAFLSLFCSSYGGQVEMFPICTVSRFYVMEDGGGVVIADPTQYHICLLTFYGRCVVVDVFASVDKKQSLAFGPLGLQQAGESLYKQSLRDQWHNFSSYYGKMALSNVCMEWDGAPPF